MVQKQVSQGKENTQGCEHQQVEICGDHLRGCPSYLLRIPRAPPSCGPVPGTEDTVRSTLLSSQFKATLSGGKGTDIQMIATGNKQAEVGKTGTKAPPIRPRSVR